MRLHQLKFAEPSMEGHIFRHVNGWCLTKISRRGISSFFVFLMRSVCGRELLGDWEGYADLLLSDTNFTRMLNTDLDLLMQQAYLLKLRMFDVGRKVT